MKLLIVNADPQLCERIARLLAQETESPAADVVGTAEAALDRMRAQEYDVILLQPSADADAQDALLREVLRPGRPHSNGKHSPPAPNNRRVGLHDLTSRERQVVELIARGYTNREIADRLTIEVGTVKTHVHNILAKLSLSTRLEAAAWLWSVRETAEAAPAEAPPAESLATAETEARVE